MLDQNSARFMPFKVEQTIPDRDNKDIATILAYRG